MSLPGYWMYETSGRLRPAVEAYLRNETLDAGQILALKAYLRQWINATTWDENPFMDVLAQCRLRTLRQEVNAITSRDDISDWLAEAVAFGMDPL